MDCNIPSSHVIPAVAARLKYYVDIERKEVGFDLSLNPRDTNEKYRLYEQTSHHTLHQNQRIKKHFIDKQMEAALRHRTIKYEADKKEKMETKQERRREVQRKIKKNMSALAMPDQFPNNCIYLSSLNQKSCDLEGLSSIPPDLSHGEFKRLVASAADLIVATTPGCPLGHLHQHKDNGVKADTGHPYPCTRVTMPASKQSLTLNKESHTQCAQNVTANNKNVNYEIVVHVGAISPEDASPSLLMRLIGENGKSKTLFLHNILYSGTTSSTGQVVSSHVKAKDVGELKEIMIGVDDKEQDCRCYCISITILKGKTNYVFMCKKWLSHQMVMICPTACDSMDSHPQAEIKGAETHQTEAKTCKLSDNSSNTFDYNNNPSIIMSKIKDLNSHESMRKIETSKKDYLNSHESLGKVETSKKDNVNAWESTRKVETSKKDNINSRESMRKVETSKKDNINSRESMRKVETSKKDDLNSQESTKKVKKGKAKNIVDKKISSTETEVSKQIKVKKLEVSQTNNIKSPGSPKRYKNKESKRKMLKRHVSSEAKIQDISYCKEETSMIKNQSGKDQSGCNQDPKSDDTHVNNITEDDIVDEPMLENSTTVDITKERNDSHEDLQEKKPIHADGLSELEHRRASSPAGYVFFSYKTQELPILDKVNIYARRNTGSSMNPNSRNENTNPTQGTTKKVECSSLDNNRDNNDKGASNVYFLQQILLESEGNLKDSSPEAKYPPYIDNLENVVKTESQYEKSDQSNEVQSVHAQTGGFDDPYYPLDTEALQHSGCFCSCENCCSYESDSTLNEEYLFSDSSSDCEDCAVFAKLTKDTKESAQKMLEVGTARQDMRIRNNYHIYKERKVNSCNENSDIFQRSLATIQNSDVNSLRNFCNSYFFLPSIKDEESKTLLHHAAAQDNPHIIQVLLDTTVGMLNIDQQDIFNKTALQYAVEKGNTKTIQLLLDRGANV